jgi:hypothetical protein
MQPDVEAKKRIRGVIIDVLYGRHANQLSRVDHVALWHILINLGCDLGEDEMLTQLQDLFDRGYVSFNESRDRRSNRPQIFRIQLTSRGRDLREQTITDKAVSF